MRLIYRRVGAVQGAALINGRIVAFDSLNKEVQEKRTGVRDEDNYFQLYWHCVRLSRAGRTNSDNSTVVSVDSSDADHDDDTFTAVQCEPWCTDHGRGHSDRRDHPEHPQHADIDRRAEYCRLEPVRFHDATNAGCSDADHDRTEQQCDIAQPGRVAVEPDNGV